MNRNLILLLLVGALFLGGVVYMLNIEFAAGYVYPQFSTLRTDPRGTRLLFDSLSHLPGVAAIRNYAPLESLRESRSSIVILGLSPSFGADSGDLKLYERLAQRGNRVIAGFAYLPGQHPTASLDQQWHVKLGIDFDAKRGRDFYFREAPGWQPIERVGDKLVAMERRFGEGVIVLLASSEDFSNESSISMDRLSFISTVLGDRGHIVFDEAHLGIAESGSVVGLARRFRLSGMALGLGLCAALFIWRNASAFPRPTAAPPASGFSGRTSRAGLLTLLHRHIPPSGIVATCWQEWLSTNRRSVGAHRIERAAAVAANRSAEPLEAAREIQTILRGR